MSAVTLTINLNIKCAECRNGGAMDSGICMACAAKVMQGKAMKSAEGKAVQARLKRAVANARRQMKKVGVGDTACPIGK